MVYSVIEIERDVRIALDQNNSSAQLLSDEDIDTLSLDEIVRSKIEEAVRRVHMLAPVHLLEAGHDFADDDESDDSVEAAIYWEKLESGWILLPDDFMRLTAFRMSDWERTVYDAITPADPEYALQSSRYKGLRGNPQKPVVAIVNRPEGKALEFYSCRSEEAYPEIATYIPYPKITDGMIDISERCYRSAVYMAAALTLTTLGEADGATAMTELSKTLLEQ